MVDVMLIIADLNHKTRDFIWVIVLTVIISMQRQSTTVAILQLHFSTLGGSVG